MGTASSSPIRRTRKAIRRTLAVRLLLLTVAALEIGRRGLPASITRRIEDSLSSDLLCTEIGRTTITPSRGIEIRDVAVYAKGVPGPALIRARRARIVMRPKRSLNPAEWIEAVTVNDAQINPFPYRDARTDRARLPSAGPDVPEIASLPIDILRADLLGIPIRNLHADISVHGGVLSATDLSLDVAPYHAPSEPVEGECHLTLSEGTIEGRLSGKADLGRVVPLLKAVNVRFVARIAERFDFSTFPATAAFQFSYTPGGSRELLFQASAESCSYRGVKLLRGHGTVKVGGARGWEHVEVGALELVRTEGTARGHLRYDIPARRLEMAGRSTLDLEALADIVGVLNTGQLDGLKPGAPFDISADGAMVFGESRSTEIHGHIECAAIEAHRIPLQNAAADYTVGNATSRLEHVTAALCGGTAEGGVIFSRDDEGLWHYAAHTDIRGARFGDLCDAITGDANAFGGSLTGSLALQAPLSREHTRAATGQGRVNIDEADLFRLPIFAGMTGFMARTIPGVDSLVTQSDASFNFSIDNGKLHTDDIGVEGGVFSLIGKGDYHFTDELDFAIQLRLLKQKTLGGRVLKVLTFPISKLFEFKLTGSRADPEWFPVNFSMRSAADDDDDDDQQPVVIETPIKTEPHK